MCQNLKVLRRNLKGFSMGSDIILRVVLLYVLLLAELPWSFLQKEANCYFRVVADQGSQTRTHSFHLHNRSLNNHLSVYSRLEAVKYNQGKIQSNGRHLAKPNIRFDRKKLVALSNVALQSEDGEIIACHKCILCARLEYFNSMLGSGWIETSMSDSLSLPVLGNVLKIIVDYLYTDTATVIHSMLASYFGLVYCMLSCLKERRPLRSCSAYLNVTLV